MNAVTLCDEKGNFKEYTENYGEYKDSYDTKNIKCSIYISNGTKVRKEFKSHDNPNADNKQSLQIQFHGTTNRPHIVTEYDEKGKEIREKHYNVHGKMEKDRYVENGKVNYEWAFSEEGRSQFFQYNKDGACKYSLAFDSDNNITNTWIYFPITRFNLFFSVDLWRKKFEIEYHIGTEKVASKVEFYRNGNPKQEKFYSNFGGLIGKIEYYKNGNIEKERYYDEHGELIGYANYKRNGEIIKEVGELPSLKKPEELYYEPEEEHHLSGSDGVGVVWVDSDNLEEEDPALQAHYEIYEDKITYYESGKIKSFDGYKDDMRYTRYHRDDEENTMAMEIRYHPGVPGEEAEASRQEFYENGKTKTFQKFYEDGYPISGYSYEPDGSKTERVYYSSGNLALETGYNPEGILKFRTKHRDQEVKPIKDDDKPDYRESREYATFYYQQDDSASGIEAGDPKHRIIYDEENGIMPEGKIVFSKEVGADGSPVYKGDEYAFSKDEIRHKAKITYKNGDVVEKEKHEEITPPPSLKAHWQTGINRKNSQNRVENDGISGR